MPFVGRTNGKRERDMRSDGAFPFLSAILGLRRVSSPYHNKSCSEAIVVLGIRPWPGVNGAVVKGGNDIEERRVASSRYFCQVSDEEEEDGSFEIKTPETDGGGGFCHL